MPDFDSLVSSTNEESQERGSQSNDSGLDNQTAEGGIEQPQQAESTFETPEQKRSEIGNRVQAQNDPIGSEIQFEQEAGQNSVGADITGRDWVSEVGNSFMRGLGDHVVGGFGDVAQVIGSAAGVNDMMEGNVLSKFLQEKGDDISSGSQVYMPEELKNPEFSIKTLANPQFWSKHGAEYIPQLAEFIFLSKGAGALFKKGAQGLAKGAVKKGLLNKKNLTRTLKNGNKKLASGADEVNEIVKGKGLLGKAVTNTGHLTAKGGIAAETVGAGMASNIATGLLNSAEAYNSRKELTDKDGNPLFTKEELSDIAAKTFSNNLMYMGIDILSWGMTYGKAGDVLKASNLLKKGSQAFGSGKNLKNISAAFTAKTSPTLRKIAGAAATGIKEGYEETFQETYENWAAMMAESDVMGTKPKYDTFMDFYNSEENEGTKTIAFALGALGGGVSGAVSSINKDAERSRQLYNRTENLKTVFDASDQKGKEWQQFHKRETVSDMVLQGKTDMFEAYAEQQLANGTATEEEITEMAETIEEYQALDDQSEKLNVRGKYALFKNHTAENFFTEQIENEKNKLEEQIEILAASDLTENQINSEIEKRTQQTDKIIEGLGYGVAQAKANKANLILGKAVEKDITPVFGVDENGKETVSAGLSQADFKYYVDKENADILKPGNQAEVLKDNLEHQGATAANPVIKKIGDLGNKARSMFDNLFSKSKEDEQPNSEESTTGTTEGDTSTETESKPENDEGVPPTSSTGQGTDGNSQTNDDQSNGVQGEENSGKGTNEDGNESEDVVSENISDEELNELLELEDQLESEQKKDKPVGIDDIKKKIAALVKKAKGATDSAIKKAFPNGLPEGITEGKFEAIKAKIDGGIKLTTAEQKTVNKFKDAFNKVKGKNKSTDFQNFVNEQAQENSKTNEITKGVSKVARKQSSKIKKALKKSNDKYIKGNNPVSINEKSNFKEDFYLEYFQTDGTISNKKRENKKSRSSAIKVEIDKKNPNKAYYKFIESYQDMMNAGIQSYDVLLFPIANIKSENFDRNGTNIRSINNSKGELKLENGIWKVVSKIDIEIVSKEVYNNSPVLGKESRDGETDEDLGIEQENDNAPVKEHVPDVPSMGTIKYGPSDIDKMVAINQRLNFIFPNADNRVNAYILDDLNKALGIRGTGLAIASSIFVRSDKWNQGETFMHEMTHVFYKFAKNRPETLSVLKSVAKKKGLIEKIESRYPDYILYSFGIDADGNNLEGTFSSPPTQEDLDYHEATKLPLSQQKHILEEAFVAEMQGPLSKKYNSFFGLSEEAKRTTTSRKWWKMIDTKAKSDPQYLQENKELIRKLNDGKDLSIDNMRDYIALEFLKEVPKIESSELGFESRTEAYNAAVGNRKANIKIRLDNETSAYVAENNKELFKQKEDLLGQVLDEVSDTHEDSDFVLTLTEKSFQSRSKKASKLVNNFIKEYNRAIRLRKTIWGKEGVLFDKDDFRYKLFKLAEETDTSIDFIDAIENSPHADLKAFSKFLDIRTPEAKTVMLNSTWTLYSNQRTVAAVNNVLSPNKDGSITHKMQESLSKGEQTKVQNILSGIEKARTHFRNRDGHLLGDQYADFEAIVDKIKNGTAVAEDYVNAYRFISVPGIKLMDILENGHINIKGTNYSPVTVLRSFIDNDRHLGAPAANGKRYLYGYNFKPIANALVATNRKYTQDSVVENAKGNMVPVRMMNNHVTKELDQMYASLKPSKDGKIMTKDNFIKRYSHITSSKKYRKAVPNQFLESFYDSVTKGNRPDIVYYTGINDTVTNNANAFEDSTSYEQSFEDFMTYHSSAGKSTYLANVGVFGDSPRKYYMPTKRLNMSNDTTTAAYDIYRNISDDNISKRAFDVKMKAEGQKEIEFFNKNGKQLMKISSMKDLFNSNGKLNDKGLLTVKGYAYNQIVNGLFMAEVMSPNIKISSIAKRLKNAGSPVISVNKNLKFEPIFFQDPSGDEASTDGGMFILREDAERWANAGKGVFDLNEGFKFLNYSVEKDNKNFKGDTVLLKGYTTILDAEFVAENPKFKGLYDLMQSRRKKYFESYAKANNGAQPSINFTDGLPNSFPIAIPFSAEKSGIKGKMKDAPFLNELTDAESVTKAEAFQDGLMYDKDKFIGVSGYNFGPQQVMDKVVDKVTLPVQQMNSLLVHALNLGHLEEAEGIQQLISDMMLGELDGMASELKSKDVTTYKSIVFGQMNKEDMDQVQRFVIDKYGVMHPRAIEIVSNQLANTLKSKGNKLRVDGTYAHQKSAYGWEIPVDGEIKGSNELNGYTDSSSGLNRAEIVLPKHLEGKVKPRRYYTLDSELGELAKGINDNKNYLDSSKTPKENDLARLKNAADIESKRRGYTAQPVLKDGKVIGYYAPGETVIATRVPSNGPNFTGIFEAVAFTTGLGNQVQVPTSFTKTIGADLDGDALFIQHKGSNKKMNEVIDRMEKLWLSESMAPFIQTAMDTNGEGEKLKAHVAKQFPDYIKETPLAFSPSDRRKSYEDSMVAKRNIGTVFNLHRMANTLAAYRANMNEGITVDGSNYQIFEDIGDGDQSRNHKSALVANLILDNLNENAADALNINEHTVSAFSLMVNLNVPIEDVASMMNAPMVKEYVNIMNENNSAFHGYTPRKDILKKLSNTAVKGSTSKVKYDSKSKGGVTTDALNPNFYSQSNQSNIINLLMKMDAVNADLQKVSKIMSGHNGIETNPYLLEKQVQEFKAVMSNQDSSVNIPEAMASNPDISRYLKTAETVLEHTQAIDPVYRPAMTSLLQGLATKQGLDVLSNNQIRKYTKSMGRFLNSHISGHNTIAKSELARIVDPKNPESVFAGLSEYVAKLKMDGKLESNLLLSKAMNMKFEGNKPYISMNSGFFDESLTPQEIKKLNKEFIEMPLELQHDLFYYDMAKNGWNSPLSLLPVTDAFINEQLIQSLNEDFKNKGEKKYSRNELQELEHILMLKDFSGPRNNIPYIDVRSASSQGMIEMQKNPAFKKALENNTPLYFKSRDNSGKLQLLHFVGNTKDVYSKPISDNLTKLQDLAKNGIKKINVVPNRTANQLDIDLVTIKSGKDNNPIVFNKKSNILGLESRATEKDIEEIFRESPSMYGIGSKKDYSNYLKTIFINSKVKNILYHGTRSNFEFFRKSKLGGNLGSPGDIKKGFWFSESYEGAEMISLEDLQKNQNPNIKKVLINLKNPFREDVLKITGLDFRGHDLQDLKNSYSFPGEESHKGVFDSSEWDLKKAIVNTAAKNGNDGLILKNMDDLNSDKKDPQTQYVVFDEKNIHILGSQKDRLMFKVFKKKDNFLGMEAREEFWDYSSQEELSQSKFNNAMEFGKFQTQESKQAAYESYLVEKEKANSVYNQKFRGQDFTTFSPEKLMELYNTYGNKNAYAYSIITTPIIKALAAKISSQQSKLTGKHKGDTDIGAVQSWLMSNDIPSSHPDIQGMVRNMLKMEKQFQNEKKQYTQKINDSTNTLYKEKFGFMFDSRNPIQLAKRFYYSYIHNRASLYKILYGNIIEENTIESEGKTIKEFKLKSKEEIESLKSKGQLSEAEYNFYKTFREITGELEPFSSSGGKKVRRDYIPHVSQGQFESFSNRGILGLLQSTKSENELLANVKMFVTGEDGTKQLSTMKEIDTIYNSISAASGNKLSNIQEYIKLRRKAKQLLKSGKNEDGTDLEVSSLEMDSALSFGVMNRFANSRSVKATEIPSMDLNHALNSYVHATLFTNGNGKFSGFKNIQGVVDGILALNQEKGFKNASKYVKLNWKDYYLKGKRQELLGKKGDKVVDLMTKMNLFWHLGFKASFVINNVIAGKYHNVKNGSVKEWAKGESRFWGVDSESKNPLTIMKRFKRSQKILKTLNFMEINVYDNVSMSSKGRLDNFLGDLALMPMTWSENWIQGVEMVGKLSESEWAKFDDNGDYKFGEEPIDNGRLTMLENEVKKSQGKGYQATDQRMIQQYSLGRMMLQFSRFLPTMVNDRFAKQDIDIYGNEHIGSMRMIFKTLSEVQSMNPKDYIKYRKELQASNPDLAKRLDSGLKGMAMSALIGATALTTNNRLAEQSFWDANYYADIDRLKFKLTPSALRTTSNMLSSLTE